MIFLVKGSLKKKSGKKMRLLWSILTQYDWGYPCKDGKCGYRNRCAVKTLWRNKGGRLHKQTTCKGLEERFPSHPLDRTNLTNDLVLDFYGDSKDIVFKPLSLCFFFFFFCYDRPRKLIKLCLSFLKNIPEWKKYPCPSKPRKDYPFSLSLISLGPMSI